MTVVRHSFFMCLLFLLAGCVRLGPEVIQSGGNDYNIAVQNTQDEQMLLNLVRLKYRDTPFFLQVGSVSSQFRTTTEGSASANLGSRPILDTLGLSAKQTFTEQPTVTYTPLGGNDFVQRMLTPISLDTVMLLSNSGWSVERILRLCTQYMNGVPNAPTASGPTPGAAPEYEAFSEMTSLLRELQTQKLLRLGYRQNGDKISRTLVLSPTEQTAQASDRFMALLGLDGQQKEFLLAEGQGMSPASGTVSLSTRSLLGVLFYLSHSVQVPDSDKSAGIVTITRDGQGNEFDWTQLTRGLFVVRSSDAEPQNASIKTRYRGHWFYIDDADLDSKSTFSLLNQIFALQAGDAEGAKPLLTLPIGQ